MSAPHEKLREFPNPYDFANPVSDEKQFFGRTIEISDLTYYLNHAKNTKRPIHLAVTGERAAGKTSFLNIAAIEANRRDFCCVRVNLNEGDVSSDLNFFRKVFNSVVTAAIKCGAFGGQRSPTYFALMELNATGKYGNLEKIPLVCSILIAQAVKGSNTNFNVPDDLISEDLEIISNEIKKPIIILFDECNVLKENRIILEKLRNIFMNMAGYMLVMAATEDFFPIMDEVFSPIMRQFKKLDIGAFKSDDDVRECVQKPLERIQLDERTIRSLTPESFLSEVQVLTGRKPYEIQLVCHELFKRCQEGRAKRFALNLPTLEAIQGVLARGHDLEERPIIRRARQMKSNLLEVLEACCGGTEHLSITDTWRMEYLLNGDTRWTEYNYRSSCQELAERGIIKIGDGGVQFAGDQFDRIYIKYLAKSKNARVSLSNNSIEDWFFMKIGSISEKHQCFFPISGAVNRGEFVNVDTLLDLLSTGVVSDGDELAPMMENLALHLMYQEPGATIRLFEVRFRSDLATGQTWFFWTEPEHQAGLRKLRRDLDALKDRGNLVGIEIETNFWDMKCPSPTEICAHVQRIGNEQLANRVANELMDMVQFYYVRRKNKGRALECAEAAFTLRQSRSHEGANNVGYLYLDRGDLEEAKLWLEAAIQYIDEWDTQLAVYNLAMTNVLEGNFSEAKTLLRRALQEKEGSAACLHRLIMTDDGAFGLEEVLSPDSVSTFATEALDVIARSLN